MTLQRWRADLATALIMLAAELLLFWSTFSFARSPVRGYPGAGFFPRIILVFLMVFTVAIALQALAARRTGGAGGRLPQFPLSDFAVTLATGIAFAVLIPWAGFELTLFLVMLVLLYPRVGATWAAGASLATVLVAWLIFILFLGVSAPLLFLPQFLPL